VGYEWNGTTAKVLEEEEDNWKEEERSSPGRGGFRNRKLK